jgi:hypothetical protein
MAGSSRTACPLARPHGGTSVSDDAGRACSGAPGQRSDQQSAKESARALSALPHAARSAAPFGAALDHLPPAPGSGRSLPRPVPGTKWMRWPTYDRKLKGVAAARSSGGRRLGRLRRGQRRFGGRQRSGRSHCHNVVSQRGLSAREPPPPRPLCKPLGPPAPLVAIPFEVVQGPTQLVVADPDLAKELLNV